MIDEAASDADLAQRAAGGDEAAFTALMRRHKQPLYQLVRRHVGDVEEAEDLLQEAFVSAWSGLVRYDVSRPFYIWLAHIALNKCRDRGRRLAVRRLIRGNAGLWEAVDVEDMTPSPETSVADRQKLARIDRAISQLPVKLKEPLILTAINDLSHAQVADLLGVSVKTVETRIYRARQKLSATVEKG